MESVFAEMPLALFTTLSSVGAGAFIAMAGVVFAAKLKEEELAKLDRLGIVPFLVACVGFACAFFHLASPLNAFGVFGGVGSSPLSNEIVAGVVFMVAAAVYVVLAWTGKLSGGARRGVVAVCAVLAVVFSLFMGMAYMMYTIPSFCLRFMGLSSALGFGQVQLLTALMLFLSNALPNVAGMGSIETAFLLVFGAFLTRGETMSVLMLFRIATYYVVVAVSAVGFFFAQKNVKKLG